MMQKTTKIFQLALTKILLNLGFSSDCTHNTSLANYHFTRFGYFIYLGFANLFRMFDLQSNLFFFPFLNKSEFSYSFWENHPWSLCFC